MTLPRNGIKAFTLVELLVVVAIIALLIAILLPAMERARATARMVTCQSQHRQIALGMRFYANDYKGKLCSPNRRYDYVIWRGTARFKVWVGWSSEFLIGQHIGNKAITCSAIWPPPDAVNPILYCPELTREQMTFKQLHDMPWRNGIGMNNSTAYSDKNETLTRIPLGQLNQPASLGLLADANNGTKQTPTLGWKHITREENGVALDKKQRNRTSEAHNAYRHLGNTVIAFADGHSITSADAVAEQESGTLTLSE